MPYRSHVRAEKKVDLESDTRRLTIWMWRDAVGTILTLSFVIITASATLKGLDPSLEKAAATLGAGPTTMFFKVTLPLIKRGTIRVAVFAYMIFFDETVVAIFLSSSHAITFPK